MNTLVRDNHTKKVYRVDCELSIDDDRIPSRTAYVLVPLDGSNRSTVALANEIGPGNKFEIVTLDPE